MPGYQVTIKNADETIELSTKDEQGKPEVTSVRFAMNTLDDKTKNKSGSIRYELEIKGTITPENKDRTKLLAKWALDFDQKTLYRDVDIVVYAGENCTGEVLRRYEASKMFVIDYAEDFTKADDGAEKGTYELWIAQREGNEKKEVFAS